MKFHSSDNWNKIFDCDGVLYFSQRCEEMLFHYASEKYKVPLLNTKLLISEYLITETLINRNKISQHHLDYIFGEFLFSFSNDIAIKEGWGKVNVDRIVKSLVQLIEKRNPKYLNI